jgi:hypothetical protein
VITVRTSSYVLEDKIEGRKGLEAYFNYERSGLSAYGIAGESILDAYDWILQRRHIRLPIILRETTLKKAVDEIISDQWTKSLAVSSSSLRPGTCKVRTMSRYAGDVIALSDIFDYEANCTILILRLKLLPNIDGGFFAFPLEAEGIHLESYRDKFSEILANSSHPAIMVMLTSRFIYEVNSLQMLIEACMAQGSERAKVVPILLPLFEFPDSRYYDKELPALLAQPNDASRCEVPEDPQKK